MVATITIPAFHLPSFPVAIVAVRVGTFSTNIVFITTRTFLAIGTQNFPTVISSAPSAKFWTLIHAFTFDKIKEQIRNVITLTFSAGKFASSIHFAFSAVLWTLQTASSIEKATCARNTSSI
jgi:hypothetical protein